MNKPHWSHCRCPNRNAVRKARRDRERARKRTLSGLLELDWFRVRYAQRAWESSHPLPCNCAACIAVATREEHAKMQRGEPYTKLWD